MKTIIYSGKWILVLSVVLAVLLLAACSSSSNTTSPATIPPAAPPTVAKPPATIPPVTIPAVTTPVVPTPAITTPVITTPAVTPPPIQTPPTPLTGPSPTIQITTPAASSTPPSTSPPATSPASSGQAVTINLIAKGMAFDKKTLSVPAGASVTIIFANQDAGIPHNVSVYQNLPGGDTKPVFIGDVITGPSSITYHFTAPAAQGSYYFVCDIHPQLMNGPFVITP